MKRIPSLIVAAALVAGASTVAHAEVTVIVHAGNGASLDDEAIANLFLGQTKTFAGGAEATPVNQKDSAGATGEFASRYLKKTPAQLRAFWAKQVFTGAGRPPKELDGDDAVIKFVAATPGAIGYIEGKPGPGVKAAKK